MKLVNENNTQEFNSLEVNEGMKLNSNQIVMALRQYNTYLLQFRASGNISHLHEADKLYEELKIELERYGLEPIKKHR